MKRLLLLTLSVFAIAGCQHNTVKNFKPAEISGVSGSKTTLFLYSKSHDSGNLEVKNKAIDLLASELGDSAGCDDATSSDTARKGVSPGVIPIIASLGKYVFDSHIDKKERRLSELKKSAQATYSARIFANLVADKANNDCLVFVRYQEEDGSGLDIGLIYVFKIINSEGNHAYVVSPVYIKANNSVAVSAEASEVDGKSVPVKISTTLAMSVKAIGSQDSGLPALLPVGEGVISIPNLAVGSEEKAYTCLNCVTSDLIPYYSASGNVSVTVSITETGKVGIHFDKRSAELKALKEALGPAISDAITAELTEE